MICPGLCRVRFIESPPGHFGLQTLIAPGLGFGEHASGSGPLRVFSGCWKPKKVATRYALSNVYLPVLHFVARKCFFQSVIIGKSFPLFATLNVVPIDLCKVGIRKIVTYHWMLCER